MKNFSLLLPALALAFHLLLSGCDKKPGPPTPTAPVADPAYDGLFETEQSFIVNGGFVSEVRVARAYFSSVPVTSVNLATGIEATDVRLNGKALGRSSNTAEVMYLAQEDSLLLSPEQWAVAGKNTVPSFTYTDPTPRPSGISFSDLPQTIDRSNGVIIDLSGVRDFEKGDIHLSTQGEPVYKWPIDKNTSFFTLPMDKLASFTDDKGYLMITLYNFSATVQGGKQYKLTKILHLARRVDVVD